jgi:transposase
MKPILFFLAPHSVAQKQYEALRLYFVESVKAREVAKKYGYTYRGFTTIVSEFRNKLREGGTENLFFVPSSKGRPSSPAISSVNQTIIELRKKYYSVPDIKIDLDGRGVKVSEKSIYNVVRKNGFSRLPRRMKASKQHLSPPTLEAPVSNRLGFRPEDFKSGSAGLLCFLPYIHDSGIDKLVEKSAYPETSSIDRLSSILCFLALKLSNARRYSADNLWCMDRGLGLFAGLNVLPKAAWFTSYSHRVTSDMNRNFLSHLHQLWLSKGLLGDTANMDFTTIPYWGDGGHLENNWSGKRGKALESMLAVLAHNPDSGIIDYGSTNVLHKDESSVVLEYLDFYSPDKNRDLKYLVFDSKFTNYQNLNTLNQKNIKFLTIRRRGKNMVGQINNIPVNAWKTKRVEMAGNKHRTLKVFEQEVALKDYQGKVRQIIITGNGKTKPAIIITNDFELGLENVIRKYARRWLVEKTISEQIEFFHLNHVSSSMVIKVDFDLTMSILAHNLYRLVALNLERYGHLTAQSVYEKFILNEGDVQIEKENIIVKLKKKRNLPLVLETMKKFETVETPFLKNKKLIFQGASYS